MTSMLRTAAIVPAAGSGIRMGLPGPKQFYDLDGVPILVHTVRVLARVGGLDGIVLVVPADQLARTREMVLEYQLERVLGVVAGGRRRQDSVRAGLDFLPDSVELVLVHDGVRPFVTPDLVEECLRQADVVGAAMAAIPVKDTLKTVADLQVVKTVDREQLWQAQTPQAMRVDLLRRALIVAEEKGMTGTDEASLLEAVGCPVTVVPGSERNIKITRPEDLRLAEAIMHHDHPRTVPAAMRVGHGYDVHQLVVDRPLVLGGVTIPHSLGLAGHSDADVLTHALCDAVLGALGAGDLGRHFPDTDKKYKDIRSLRLLEQVIAMAADRGYLLANADITVVAQRPCLAEFVPEIVVNLATACQVDQTAVNCKATTTEKLGFAGREQGIAAHAVVLLSKN
ncbi:MAG: 2-C-methyl-D-erythritol 4-phosphate cytidylyltransferase [Desulfobacterales bacterium]|nr:2-C-methyl-D-erythritol 4-phosphate cytidylyltransferase [Desulfobacterales bacterium]